MRSIEERNRMAEENIGLAYKAVEVYGKGYIKRGSPYISAEDLLQTASITLLKAAEKYDETRGYEFSTYAMEAMRRDFYLSYHNLFTPAECIDYTLEMMEEHQEAADRMEKSYQAQEDRLDFIELKMCVENLLKQSGDGNHAALIKRGFDIIMLKYHDMTIKEAAEKLGITFAEAKSAYQTARVFFRKEREAIYGCL